MTRMQLIHECSRQFGKRAWLGASNEELQRCLDTSTIPAEWSSGRSSENGAPRPIPAATVPSVESAPVMVTDRPVEAPTVPIKPSNGNGRHGRSDDLADVLAAALQGKISAGIDCEQVETIVRRIMAEAPKPTPTEIRLPDGSAQNIGAQHCQFAEVLQTLVACGQVWIAGPAGSGKTTLAEACAKALNLPFYFNGAIDSPYKLAGFIDAQGRIVRPAFRQAYENGGVYLFDEVDASMPSAVLAFNAAMSNGKYDFPDGTVERHKDFYCVAAANTFGLGATDDYVGRMKQDAAFLDRFPSIYLDYDESLERTIAGNDDWTRKVQACRRIARERGLRVVISPRASIFGSKLLAAGMDMSRVAEMTVRKGMSADHWEIIGREGMAA